MKFLKIFFYLLGFCFLILIFFVGFISYGLYQVYFPLSNNQGEKIIEIARGQGVEEIAEHLESKNLIRSSFWFKAYIWLEGKQGNLQAGQYQIDSSLNTAQIAQMILAGRVLTNEIRVTFPEGFTLKQIKVRLQELGFQVAEQIDKEIIVDFKPDYQFLDGAPETTDLQGFLFPDTYKFKKDVSSREILMKMLDNFDKKLTEQMRQDIKNQGRSIFEIITMASLLEKEVKTAQDRKIVSGIFWKRVKNGYPLESDATLSYIFDDKKDRHSLEETKVDSPYNTYRYAGLPSGPINNPGLDAIEAAIYPQESDYYFFLTKPDSGEVVYAKTLQEHNANKAKYLK